MIKSNKNYVFVALCLAVVLCTAMLLVGLNFNQCVYADYQDILDDPNAVVNFNQFVSNDYVNNCTLSSGYTNIAQNNFIGGHVFYIRFELSSDNSVYYELRFRQSDNSNSQNVFSGNRNTNFEDIVTLNLNYNYIYLSVYAYSSLKVSNAVLIDLTQMFGSNDNIPTLEQCQELFISPYYNYTTGTVISLNGLNSYMTGYTEGFNNAWESQNITFKQNVIGSSAFPYNWNEYSESVKSFDGINMAYLIGGVIGVPLGNIVSGTNIEVDFNFLVTDWSQEPMSYRQDFNLYFYYIDSNSNLVLCGTIPYYNIDGAYGTYKGSFNVPINTDTIYMYFSTSPNNWDTSPTLALVFDSSMVFRTQDVYSAINTAFQSGIDSVIQSYAQGGAYYNRIYNAGKTAGLNEQNPYTFGYLMSSVIEAPLNAVLGIFNFDFMGYNFKDVITLLLTVCVIIAVVRMFVGGAA